MKVVALLLALELFRGCIALEDPASPEPPSPAIRPLVLRHDGVGPLGLGMSPAEARAAGAEVRRTRTGTGCWTLTASRGGTRITGDIDPDVGVSMLWASGTVTEEGVGPGSTVDDLRSSYAHLAGDGTLLTAPLADGATYRFDVVEGIVDSVRLLDPRQGCAS